MSKEGRLQFRESAPSASGKTFKWNVLPKFTGNAEIPPLGVVMWFGRWRKYCFFPTPETLFDHECLGEIAEFLKTKSREHYEARHDAQNDGGRVAGTTV